MELAIDSIIYSGILFLAVAVLYSSIGHAGASGYMAVMILLNFKYELIRPTALLLNIFVGVISFVRFYKAKLIDFKKVVPFLLTSVPFTFYFAQVNVDKKFIYLFLGFVLLFSAANIFYESFKLDKENYSVIPIPNPMALLIGAIIGTISGLTGTGGAIFLTPILLKFKWTQVRESSGVSIVFVLINSIFGILGLMNQKIHFKLESAIIWIVCVCLGAIIGSHLGVIKYSNKLIKRVIALVMIIACFKLVKS